MIEVRNLVKRYDDYLAVDDISFDIEEGKIYGFLGPNGAGKSTTLNMMTGCLSSTEGTIKIMGHDIYEEPKEAKKYIGYLPELPPIYPDMTAREYLKFVAQLKHIPKKEIDGHVEEVMKKARIDHVADRQMKQLSKGYRQRCGIAQAIVGYPKIIILDEPTVGLDPLQMVEIREWIKELAQEHTIILSSHILTEISAICDRVIIINKGKLYADDTIENLDHMLSKTNRLSLTVVAREANVRSLLKDSPFGSSFEINPSEEKNAVDVSIDFEKEEDLRAEVFMYFAKAGYPIIKMNYDKKSLEEIFSSITQQGEK
ncbi:MAG: ABC transporter ATP-binding protein [Lachnospiraceae bacterium]|nr:ABC transporter ATP-binding protein [Candidatus Equihabitans merdae]